MSTAHAPRVVITGVGLISAAGLDRARALARLATGPLDAQPPADAALDRPLLLPIAEGFKPAAYVKHKKELKLMAPANVLALAAAQEALAESGTPTGAYADAGLFLGVGREPGKLSDLLPTLAHSRRDGQLDLDTLVREGMHWMHPLTSLKTLPNMSVAHLAIALQLHGPNGAYATEADAGPTALIEAFKAIQEGRCPWALAGASDSRVAFSDRLAASRLGALDTPLSEAAAVFVLEPLDAARARGATILAELRPRADEPDVAADALGDCGAARLAAGLALHVGRAQPVAAGPIALYPAPEPVASSRAPALHLAQRAQPVAITAVGLRTPLGANFSSFGEALLAGRSAVAPIRSFDARQFPVRNACEVPADQLSAPLPEALDAALRGRGDRRAELALRAGLAAALSWGELPAEAGCLFATGLSSVTLPQLQQDLVPFIDGEGRFDDAAFGRSTPPARPQAPWRNLVARPLDLLADHLGLRGPRACHFSACAAGGAALAHGADLLRRGVAPAMLVGAGDSMVHPFGLLPFIRLGATSTQVDPDLAGQPFDQDRDGFVMGEGAAFFVLEPLAAAKAAGRPILGLLMGAGTSLDAWRITAPHPEGLGAERAMRQALSDARLQPEDIDYINAHGTGTALNDVTEAAAIGRIFGSNGPAVSSSKAQLGHAIAAAGALELLAILAAFRGGQMPPTAHLRNPDPAIQVDLIGPQARPQPIRFALSNSFGFGGQNASLVIAHPDLAQDDP